MLKLYNIDGCGYCAMVREVLAKMGLDYEKIDVAWPFSERKEVFEVSGQYTVPVLVDGETVLADEYEIIDHLKLNHSQSSAK